MTSDYPFYCPNCSKKYIREISYNKHKLLCSSNKSMPIVDKLVVDLSRSEAIETCKTPSLLLQTVQELVKSNNVLKTEIAELKRQAHTQKKKIPIIDILNKNFTPTEDYIKYMNIEICRSDLETIFTHDLVIGIQEILQNQICLVENSECPLQAFEQKKNIIYGYIGDKWKQISIEDFNKIISKIKKNIMTEFKIWQDEHTSELYTEDFSIIYLKNVKKVMGGNITHDKLCKKFYNNLYQYMKTPLSSIEYEIS